MWIILLDHSGSMHGPFEGEVEVAGRVRISKASTKLEAAKEALLTDLRGLDPSTHVALIGFMSQASMLYEGPSGQIQEIRAKLDGLHAGGGTSIANALDFAAGYLTSQAGSREPKQVLVISDGLSDLEPARTAAERLVAASGAAIHAILIDPTEEGWQVARAIAIDGRVDAVKSAGELADQVAGVHIPELKASGHPALVREGFRREAALVTERITPDERVAFTAAYPTVVLPAQWYSLFVYCHLAHLQDAIAELISRRWEALGLQPGTSAAPAQLARGTLLRLKPRVEGLTFNPVDQQIAWLEDIHEVAFRLQAPADLAGRALLGAVDVHVGEAVVARLPISIRVRMLDEPAEAEEQATVTARTFEKIFASYAHVDSHIVDACAEVYRALGIYMLIDRTELRSGVNWRETIRGLIEDCDLFQLYWSEAASRSSEVEKEWREAQGLQSRKGDHFIRPLYWDKPLPEPPGELSYLHFAPLDLGALAAAIGRPLGGASQASKRARPRRGTKPSR
jgi:von Willebrand factor type A domain/TIR domain